HPGGRRFLSAACGLVRVQGRLYVVADDELHLGVLDVGSTRPVRLLRVLAGRLPADAKPRKKRKPDFETLMFLPASGDRPGGALLALGSGSRPNRMRGAILPLDAAGDPAGAVRPVDIEPLYRALTERFAELNIEGAFVAGGSFVLLQRGGASGPSAVVRFDLLHALAWLDGHQRRAPLPRNVRNCDLGSAEGTPFGFTDGAALPDGTWVFSAVAEARDDAYQDGPCVATAIGVCDRDDKVRFIEKIAPKRKIEGVAARRVGARLRLSVVTDADDPDQPAELGAVSLAFGGSER
ncbi:MAG: hypothetical protein ABIQ33_04820, partial [Caldimonas sp.]